MIVKTLESLSSLSHFPNYRLAAAVLSRKGDIISYGWNKKKTHPRQKKYADRAKRPDRQYLHAEIDALVKSKGDGHTLVVVRTTKNGFSMAKPCPICMLAARAAGIREIQYTDWNGELITESVV